jgi:hypothetical protein
MQQDTHEDLDIIVQLLTSNRFVDFEANRNFENIFAPKLDKIGVFSCENDANIYLRVIAMADTFDLDNRGLVAINDIKDGIVDADADADADSQNVDDVFVPNIPDAVLPPDVDVNTNTGPDPDFVNVPTQRPPNAMSLATSLDREIFAAQNKMRTEPQYY